MTAPININLEILNGSTEILIRVRKQACTSKTHQGFVVRFEHDGQHLLQGRGIYGKEKTKLVVQWWRSKVGGRGAMGGHEFDHGAWGGMGGPVVA